MKPFLLSTALLLALLHVGHGQPDPTPPPQLETGLAAFTLRPGEHERGFPLRLTLTIANRAAAEALETNADNLRARQLLRQSGRLESMSPEDIRAFHQRHPALEVPVLSWGSATTPLADAVEFTLTGPGSSPLGGTVRPLASTRSRQGPILLDGVQLAVLEFGLDATELDSWPEGQITLQAALRGIPGSASSLRIRMRRDRPWFWQTQAHIRRMYLTGTYQRADQQWTALRTTADAILKKDKSSPFGWELLGDALAATGSPDQARLAYARAAQGSLLLQRKDGDPSPEMPVYHLKRMEELQPGLPSTPPAP